MTTSEEPPTRTARVETIREMVAAGEWTSSSGAELAARWGISPREVRRNHSAATDPRRPRRAAPAMPPGDEPHDGPPRSLEELVSGERFGNLRASTLQRAICRLAEGREPGEITDAELAERCGSAAWRAPAAPPSGVALVCGVRGGKSRLAAAAVVWGALTADLAGVEPYEDVWAVVVGPTVRSARKTFRMVLGLLRRPGLAGYILGDPTADTVRIRRPDGREVSIVVVPATSGGEGVRGSWLAAIVLEEVAQWRSEIDGAAITAEDTLDAAEGRLLPGAPKWLVSSPYAPAGLLFETWKRYFGAPGDVGPDGLVPWLVVHAPTRSLNPSYPQAKIEAVRAKSAEVAAREHDAQWIDADTNLFSSVDVDACTRLSPLVIAPVSGLRYTAAIDPAARRNAFTLVIATNEARPLSAAERTALLAAGATPRQLANEVRSCVRVVLVRQWVPAPGAPLDLDDVIREVAAAVAPYGVTHIRTDGWSADALRALARRYGVHLGSVEWTEEDRIRAYEELRTLLGTRAVDLPPDAYVRSDLLGVRRRASGSTVRIVLPTTTDGRHCDFAPGLALVASKVGAAERRTREETAEEKRMRVAGEREAARLEAQARARLALDDDEEDESQPRDWRASRAWRGHRTRTA